MKYFCIFRFEIQKLTPDQIRSQLPQIPQDTNFQLDWTTFIKNLAAILNFKNLTQDLESSTQKRLEAHFLAKQRTFFFGVHHFFFGVHSMDQWNSIEL